MGLFGAGLSYVAQGEKAIWTAPISGGRGYYGSMTTLIWVRDTVMAGGSFSIGIFGGLGYTVSKAAFVTFSDEGGAVGVQQPNTGTRSIPPYATFLTPPTAQTWCPIITVFDSTSPSTRTYVAPKSATFALEVSGALTLDRIFLGDWNISRISPYPTSMPCQTTTLMAEFAIWRGKLTDADMAPLFTGANPLHVRPDLLFAYYPLNGDLLDRGPRGRGLRGPSPNFGPHPPIEPIRSRHRISTLRHVGAKIAAGSSLSASLTNAKAKATRSAAAPSRTASTSTAAVSRMMRAVSSAASRASAKASVTRKALGKSVTGSIAAARMAGPRSAKAPSANATSAAARATASRSAAAPSISPSTASAIFLASRQAAGSSADTSTSSAGVGFVRSGAGGSVSGSLAALKMNVAYAARGAAQAVSTALAGVTQTFASTSKQATGQSADASVGSAGGIVFRAASGTSTTASKAVAAASRMMSGASVSGSTTQAVASAKRPAAGAAASAVTTSAVYTIQRAALGASANASAATAYAGGPRASRGAAIGASTASAAAVISRAASGAASAASRSLAAAGHGFAVRGASASGSAAQAKMQGNMRGRSVSASWGSALALVKRQLRGVSISASTGTASAAVTFPQPGEITLLLDNANALALRVFLSWRKAAFQIDAGGAVHANMNGFVDVGVQSEAIWTLLFDILNAQPSSSSVQAALDYGFAQQALDGSFASHAGVGSRHDIEAAFSFLQFASRAVLLGQAAGSQFSLAVDQAKLAAAFAWYSANTQVATLQSVDQRSGSAMMTAATSLLLGSVVLGDSGLEAAGRTFLASALALQNKAGWFNERNAYGQEGFDAVFQGIAVHGFAVLCSYFPHETGWAAALQSAVTWLKSKIYPAVPSQGWLNVNGSVRSNGQDAPLVNGEPPDLDIVDAGFGLLLSGQLLSDAQATSLGTQVLALYDATRSAHDVIIAR